MLSSSSRVYPLASQARLFTSMTRPCSSVMKNASAAWSTNTPNRRSLAPSASRACLNSAISCSEAGIGWLGHHRRWPMVVAQHNPAVPVAGPPYTHHHPRTTFCPPTLHDPPFTHHPSPFTLQPPPFTI